MANFSVQAEAHKVLTSLRETIESGKAGPEHLDAFLSLHERLQTRVTAGKQFEEQFANLAKKVSGIVNNLRMKDQREAESPVGSMGFPMA